MNILSAKDQWQKDYESTGEVIQQLNDKEIEQLSRFANGLDTVKELPDKLAAIAVEVLKQRHIYCTTLLNWIPRASLRRNKQK